MGHEVARYDKIHLFDAMVDDAHGQYRESDSFEPGRRVVTVDTPAGRLGLAICYDLRFPELFRALREQGADWVCLPSAFTWQTGDAHWHALIRARAIENQVWVVAAGQGGQNSERRKTYGHSLICDPWGEVVCELEQGPGVVLAGLDLERLEQLENPHAGVAAPALVKRWGVAPHRDYCCSASSIHSRRARNSFRDWPVFFSFSTSLRALRTGLRRCCTSAVGQ